jgi:hypothetical protein
MPTDQSWRTQDGRWLVDRVVGEPGVGYRLWDEGELAGERPPGTLTDMTLWLRAIGLRPDELVPLDEVSDEWCE